MIYIYIGIGIVFIAALILILLKDEKDEIDSILVKIDESEDNIDILLEKKLKILCDVSKTINEKEWAEVFGVEPAATVAVAVADKKEIDEMSWVIVNPEIVDIDSLEEVSVMDFSGFRDFVNENRI